MEPTDGPPNANKRLPSRRTLEKRVKQGESPAETLVGVRVGFDLQAGGGQEVAEDFLASGAALCGGDVALAVDSDINGIDGGGVHGGQVGVVGEDDFDVARMLFEIFLYGFFGFADVDSEHEEILAGKFLIDFVNEGRFDRAEGAPGGPELEENHFAFDGDVREPFAAGSGGVEAGRGFFRFGGAGFGDKALIVGGAEEQAWQQGAGEGESEAHGADTYATSVT
jgi:hypothetical protein